VGPVLIKEGKARITRRQCYDHDLLRFSTIFRKNTFFLL
jgi:hypothetical protein